MALPPFASLSVKQGTKYRLDSGTIIEILACTKSSSGGQEVKYKIAGAPDDSAETKKAYEFKKEIWEKSEKQREQWPKNKPDNIQDSIQNEPAPIQNAPPAPVPPAPIQNAPPAPVPPAPIQNNPPAPVKNAPPEKKRGPFDFLDDIYDAVASLFN